MQVAAMLVVSSLLQNALEYFHLLYRGYRLRTAGSTRVHTEAMMKRSSGAAVPSSDDRTEELSRCRLCLAPARKVSRWNLCSLA